MILRANGLVVKVHFRHYLPDGKGGGEARLPPTTSNRLWHVRLSRHPMTECLVHLEDCRLSRMECERVHPIVRSDDQLYPGKDLDDRGKSVLAQAVCSPRDIFTKKRGREISLGRALKNLVPAHREALMADYLWQVHGVQDHRRQA